MDLSLAEIQAAIGQHCHWKRPMSFAQRQLKLPSITIR